jgi:hypothetical protein
MSDSHLTQVEAEALLAMEKVKASDEETEYPALGGSITLPLQSLDGREQFLLDISRSQIDLLKGKYQSRAQHTIILARLDFGGPPHRNPDGAVIPCPHLHLYKEGWGDKWAAPVPADRFTNLSDLWQTLQEFMSFCHITDPPVIRKGLFV